MATYVGLAIADGMFAETATASRRPLTEDEARGLISAVPISPCGLRVRIPGIVTLSVTGIQILRHAFLRMTY